MKVIVLDLLVGGSTSSLLAVLCHRYCDNGCNDLIGAEGANRALRRARVNLDLLAILRQMVDLMAGLSCANYWGH